MHRLFVLTAAAFLIAAPISLAQTTPSPEQPPVQAPAATSPPTDQPPAAPMPAPAQTSSAPSAPDASAASAASAPEGCRTRKAEGEPCACLAEPDRVGTATAHPDGHNVCVRPD